MTVIWDERLITRHRAADMAGAWQLKLDHPYLRCADCTGNVIKLPADGKIVDIDGLMSAVVRHMCMNHGYALSGIGADGG